MDEHRSYYTEWSKSERKQISYINPYIRDLEKWCWWIYLQGSDGDADTENRLVVTAGAGESGADWESSIEAYTYCL